MKKFATLLALFALVGLGSVTAQSVPPSSLQSDRSFGVFTNEIDTAFILNEFAHRPTFGSLTNNFLFSGLENLGQRANVIGATSTSFFLGYHAAGSMPWSAFSFTNLTSTGTNPSGDTTVITYSGTPVTVGTDTYQVKTLETVTTSSSIAWASLDLAEGGLVSLPSLGAIVGLNARWRNTDSRTLPGDLETQKVETEFVNTAGAGVIPVIVKSATITTDTTKVNNSDTYTFSVPAQFKLLGLPFLVGVGYQVAGREISSTSEVGNKFTTQFTGAKTDSASSDIYKRAISTPSLSVSTSLGTLVPGNPKNTWIIGTSFLTNSVGAEKSADSSSTVKNVAAGVVTNGAATSSVTSYTTEGLTGLTFGLNTSQYVAFDLDPALSLAVFPQISVVNDISSNALGKVSKTVNVVKNDNDSNGSFADAGDTKVTTTTAYTNAYLNGAGSLITAATGYTITNKTTTNLSLPAAVRIQPQGWPFTFTLASRAIFEAAVSTVTVEDSSVNTQTVKTETVGGTTVTNKTRSKDEDTKTSGSITYTTSIERNLMLSFLLPADAHLDVALSGNNLLAFDALVVQAVIPLK